MLRASPKDTVYMHIITMYIYIATDTVPIFYHYWYIPYYHHVIYVYLGTGIICVYIPIIITLEAYRAAVCLTDALHIIIEYRRKNDRGHARISSTAAEIDYRVSMYLYIL